MPEEKQLSRRSDMVGRVLLASSLLLSLASVGCLTTGGKQLTEITTPVPGYQPSIACSVSPEFAFHLDGGKLVSSNKMGNEINEAVMDRWRDKGLVRSYVFARPGTSPTSAEYSLVLSGMQDGNSSVALQIISGLTLFVIPYYVDTRYSLEYALVEKSTGRTFKASANNEFFTLVSLLLLPISPFAQGARQRALVRIADHVYRDLHAQGAFQTAPPPAVEAPEPETEAAPAPAPPTEVGKPAPTPALHSVPAPATESRQRSVEQRLQELDTLWKRRLITEDEYRERRQAILSDL